MNKTWLTSVSALALAAALAAPAKADCRRQDNGAVIDVDCQNIDWNGISVTNNNADIVVDVDVLNGASVSNVNPFNNGGTAVSVKSKGDVFVDTQASSYVNALGDGIHVDTDAGGDITIANDGTIIAGDDGLDLNAIGGGAIDASNSGYIKAVTGNGFEITGDGPINATNTGTIDALLGDGINIIGSGDGPITATNTGDIDAFDTGIDIVANGNSPVTATNSGKIDVGGNGIEIVAHGDGDILAENLAGGTIYADGNGFDITSDGIGDITANNAGNVMAHENGMLLQANAGDITVDNSGILNGGLDGVNALTITGDIGVTNSGAITGFKDGLDLSVGDSVNGIIGTGNITVDNTGTISGGDSGIQALINGNGNIGITNGGTISGADGDGVNATVEGDGDIAIDNLAGGTITADETGINAFVNGDGGITVTNSGTINAGNNAAGIDAAVIGTGDIDIANSGTINAGNDGISSFVGVGTLAVTNSGTIDAGERGIFSELVEGTLTVTNSDTINAGEEGIVSSVSVGTLTVNNSGTITAGGIGIESLAGNGDITVDNSGMIKADSSGIDSRITGNGNIRVNNSDLIDADGFGIVSVVAGNGDITISNSGTLDAGSDAILSTIQKDGDITVTNSGSIKTRTVGISSDIRGSGDITVTNDGGIVSGVGRDAIDSSITHDGNVMVTNNGTIAAGGIGIFAEVLGTGSIDIDNTNSINARSGIVVETKGGNAKVTNTGQIIAGDVGVDAQVVGDIDITNGAGALLQGALAINANATDTVRIGNAGVIRDTLAAAGDPNAVFERVINASAADAVFDNSGSLIGNVAFAAGNGAFVNNSGDWYVGGDNDFTVGPADVVNNTGTVRAFGETNFIGLEDFNNAGGLLTMLDGDDVFEATNTTGNFTGGADSVLAIDAKLGNDSGADLADLLTAANFRGQTGVAVNDLLADQVAGFNPNGVIFASFDGATDDDAFFLLGGPVDKGLFSFDVFLDEPNKDWVLASAPDASFFELPSIVTGAQQLWHDTAGAGQDRLNDLRTAIGEQCQGGLKDPVCTTAVKPGIWASVVGASTQRSQQQQNFALLNKELTFDISTDQVSSGIIGGFDIGDRVGDGSWIAGVMGGYVKSDLDFDGSTTSVDYSAALVGGYASYLNGGFFADAKVVAQFGEADYRSVSGVFSEDEQTDFTSIGGSIDVGYRMPVGGGFFIEPGASLSYVSSDVDDLAIFGEVAQFDTGESLRGRLGARIGTSFATDSIKIEPFVGLNVVQEFNDENIASVVSNGFALEAADEIQQTLGEVTVGISIQDLGGTGLSGFVKGNAQFGEQDFESYTGNAGIRLKF